MKKNLFIYIRIPILSFLGGVPLAFVLFMTASLPSNIFQPLIKKYDIYIFYILLFIISISIISFLTGYIASIYN